MIKKAVVPILNESKTSRYVLQHVPERCRDLLSPYLEWADVREIVWEACASVIEEDEKFVLKIATLAPEGTPWVNVPKSMLIPEVKELSGGKVVIKIYSGGVMGEDTDILRKMDIGQLDGCGCTALGVLKASPEASVFLMPGLFKNYQGRLYIKEIQKTDGQIF